MTEISKKTPTTTETGRSMVEMLGTLAIIGVLSIGGIAGYTYAMNKSKANDILDGVSRRALVVSQQMILGNTASLVEYKNRKIGDYDVALKTEGYPADQFGIEVSGIEQGVCEQLQDRVISNAVKVELGGVGFAEATCAEGENNVLTYVFNDTLNPNKVSTEGDEGDESGEKLWEPTLCEDSTDCLGECEQCMGGECIKSQSDTCSCSADEMEVDYDGDGVIDCIPCTFSWGMWDISADGCAKCPNREMDENDEYCVLKECPSGYLKDPYSDCYPCDSLDDIWDISAEECAKCPNRKMSESGDYCLLHECPDGYVFDLYLERCESCDYHYNFSLESPEECAKCPNREIDPSYEGEYVCTTKCPDNHYKDTHNQSCVSCDDVTATRNAKKSECDKCPNREMITYGSDNLCALKECPAGRMHDGNMHDCYSCTTTYGIPTDDQLECARCENRQWITTEVGFKACVLKECPDGKPVDDWGDC